MPKNNFYFLLFLFSICCFTTQAQVGIGTNTPDPSAVLHLQSTSKGILIPKMTSVQRTAITSPASGLLVFDTDTAAIFIYSNAAWRKIGAISTLKDIISGSATGDVLTWNGTQWVITPKASLFTYFYRDKDGDTYGDKYLPVMGVAALPGFVADSTDCNDDNAAINPTNVWYRDQDGDGYGTASTTTNACTQPSGYASNTTDCNDNSASINPVAADVPDDSFMDTNCDGIDGNEASAIFVSTSGSDAAAGTKAQPMLTIMAAIAKAVTDGKTQVYISNGVYTGRVTLTNGVSLYGGYSASNAWVRSASYITQITSAVVSSGRVGAMEGINITAATVVDRITISTGNTSATGISNYGFYGNNCTALTLKNSVVQSGSAGAGSAGTSGSSGAAGVGGNSGGAGSCDANSGGNGGTVVNGNCSRFGGAGGSGGYGSSSGSPGSSGSSGASGGSGGSGGDPGFTGQNGTAGFNGSIGFPGFGASFGQSFPFWQSNSGGTGGIGNDGTGGGGGGGGGGQSCPFCTAGKGNGGGSGGSGGCGGTGGTGGTGGGGSFGLYLINSTGLTLINNSITSGNGGAGGAGGVGGSGGFGSPGGIGGGNCTGEVGRGGNGGNGGAGGPGGYGGGGAGGPSITIFRSGTTVTTTGNTLTFGSGGAGGSSSGNPGVVGMAAVSN
jgi:hypothetical protein